MSVAGHFDFSTFPVFSVTHSVTHSVTVTNLHIFRPLHQIQKCKAMEKYILTAGEYADIQSKLDRILKMIDRSQSTQDELLTSDELIAFLKISNRTLQSYRDRRIIPFYQVGRKTFYKKDEVIAALSNYKSYGRVA